MKPSFCNPLLRKFVLATTICLSLGQAAHAATIYWDGAASANWGTAASWSTASGATTPDPAAEPAANDDVIFNITTVNAASAVLLSSTKNALSLTFNNTGTSTVRSDSTTTRVLAVGTGGLTINSGAGALTVGTATQGTNLSLAGSQTWINNSSNTATLNNTITRSNGSVMTLASGTSTFTATVHALSNSLVGTWAATGSGTSLRYVTKTSNILGAYSAGTAAADATGLTDVAGTVNYNLADANGLTPATVSANTVRFTGAAGTLSPGATSFTTRGLMNAGSGKWTIGTNPVTIGSTNELVIIGNSQETEISSAILNNGATASAVSYHGAGTLTLSGNNTFTGGLNIGAGNVLVNNPGALNSSAPNAVNFNGNSGTLTLNGNTNLSITGVNSLGSGVIPQPNQIIENANAVAVNLNLGGVSTSSTFYGSMRDGTGGGSLGITKVGTGTLTLSGTNTFSGSTQINGGVLAIPSTAGLPGWNTNSRYSVANGATLAVTNAVSDGNIATMLGTTNFAAGASIGFDTTSANRTYAAALNNTSQGALGLTKLGGNALTLPSANSYSGLTTLTNGVITLQNPSALGTVAGATIVSINGRVELDGGITVSGEALTISGSGGTGFFNGALNAKSGVNKWTGNITINSNDTRIGAQAGASIEVSGIIDSGANPHIVTFRPADTTATVIVSGPNTYVGPTTVTGGLVTVSSINSVVGGTASSSLGAPTALNSTIRFGAAEGSGLRYVGAGNETSDRAIDLSGGTQGGRIDQSGGGALKFTSAFTATGTGSKTLTLQGSTAGTGEIAGAVVNNTNGTTLLNTAFTSGATTITLTSVEGIAPGASISGTGIPASATVTAVNSSTRVVTLSAAATGAGTANNIITVTGVTNPTSITKVGTGTWTLSGTNSYTGTTAVNAGRLKLDYTTNDTSKLSDTAALTLSGTTLELVGGTHLENVGSTTLTTGTASKLVKTGGTAVLQMNTINRGAGASIDFSSSGIATTDNLNTNGILGAWATINGTDWAANSTNAEDGLITAASYTDLDAQPGGSGTTVINNGGSTNVRIIGTGTLPGSITLEASTVNINTLLQSNTTQSAVIDPGSTDILQAGGVMIGTTARALTIGSSMDDGILTAATAGGNLLLRNYSATELLTVNSTIANNTSASTLTKDGLGTVVLSGTNTYTGATNLVEGTLRAGSSQGFNGTGPLVMTASSTLDLGGYNGAFTNLTTTAANTITTTGAGSGVDTLTISALTATSPALFTDNGTRKLALSFSGANSPLNNVGNTFSGGLSIGSTVRLSVIAGTVGTPGAITNGPFGRGAITVNGGNVFDAGAQIWFAASNRNLINDVIVNGNGGMGSRAGTFRVGTNSAALTNIAISGNIDANLANAWFGSDSTSDGTALLLSGKLTGTSGFRFFVSANSSKWTTTLNNATGSPNDYAGNTVVNSAPTTLALGAANQIPNGSGKGNVDVTAGTLDLAGFSETINGLIGTGTVDNVAIGVSNILTLGDGDATGTSFSGVIKNTTGTLALTKIGTGTQTLSGANTYSGATTINGGTLALGAVGTIDNTSAISVAAGAKLETLLKSSYVMPSGKTITFGIDGAGSGSSGQINAAGLDISGATVAFNVSGPLDDAAYVLASYTSKTGAAFGSVTPPSGYTIDYSYNSGTQIALVQSVGTPYDTWIDGYPSITGLDKLPTADPDKDGLTNQQEFAFGLIPNSGSSVNPITIQLSKTTGEFTYQRLATSGLTYTIWTSPDLATWTEDTTASAGQVVTPGTPNQSVLVTLTGSKPLTATKIFVRVKAN
jgi:fibronectin-binding autotransporter adhesin